MELKYGHKKTYKHYLDKERLNWLTDRTNRSNAQTLFLFQLVDGDYEELKKLEMQLKNCFCHYCPADKEEVSKVMKLEQRSKLLEL